MLFLLRKIRRNLMKENKITTYLLYAVGEVLLVVVGILIAITIDGANQSRLDKDQQIQYYQGIITDLRKDSVHFVDMRNKFHTHLKSYYTIREEMSLPVDKRNPLPIELMNYNRTFAPVTQKNHQVTIDKINSTVIRGLLNDYFTRQESTQYAVKEFNTIVVEDSRPFFFNNNALNYDSVFHKDVYGFLPKGPMLDRAIVLSLQENERFSQILAIQRISAGLVVAELNQLLRQNSELIRQLNNPEAIED